MLTANHVAQLADCDAEDLYYRVNHPAGHAAARECAYGERGEGGTQQAFAGPEILMMIHANGHGVKRDVGLARKFACEVCDHVTGGLMSSICADHENRINDVAPAARLETLASRWSPAEKAALNQLPTPCADAVRMMAFVCVSKQSL